MSGGFHVHGPHDHQVEHAAHGGDDYAGKIAVMTAILSSIGAFVSYQGGASQNNAMLYKNEASIKQTEATNKWNHYQAKSSKQNIAELAKDLTPPEKHAAYQVDIERYQKEKADLKKEAESFQKQSEDAEKASDHAMHLHHRWAQAMTAIQIAISLSAITLLTRRKWLEYMTVLIAAVGIVLSALAMMFK
ncbi:MAG: DUF4337 domain-containing protein [Pseudomonadota bacterium]